MARIDTTATAERIARHAERLGYSARIDASGLSESRYITCDYDPSGGLNDPIVSIRIRVSRHESRPSYDNGTDWLIEPRYWREAVASLKAAIAPAAPQVTRWVDLTPAEATRIDAELMACGLFVSGPGLGQARDRLAAEIAR